MRPAGLITTVGGIVHTFVNYQILINKIPNTSAQMLRSDLTTIYSYENLLKYSIMFANKLTIFKQ